MKNTTFSPDRFFEELYNNRSTPYENAQIGDIPRISEEIRSDVKRIFSDENIPCKTDGTLTKVLHSEKRKNYTLKTVCAEIAKNWNMLCYVLEPENKNGFGVVAVPGHGYGVRQIIRQGKNGRYRKINFLDNYQKNFAEELAVRGNTVIAFEPVGFGEARFEKDMKKPFYISSCESVSSYSLLYGFSTAALRVYQARKCIDILQNSGINKFGIMGISGGGLISLYTSLMDDRIEKTVVSGYINTFGKSILSRWHCPDNYVPNLLNIGDMYDFAAALAPKKLLMECGIRDRLFPVDASKEAIEKISAVYEKLGVKDNFIYDVHNGAHKVSGRLSFDFFGKDE